MIKRWLPKTLFGRALLIVALPTVLVQLVSTYIFYERHWDNISRHMAGALAGEIALVTYQASNATDNEREALMWIFERSIRIKAAYHPDEKLQKLPKQDKEFPEFYTALSSAIDLPFTIRRTDDGDNVEITVGIKDGTMSFITSAKRLESGTTLIFLLWMSGSALVFLCIALIFLRNQIRPIRELAEAAEQFGKGRETGHFKPSGAAEVRRAGRAFLVMRERILRQIRSRTDMLAGISHDLRTPLARMKLQLALLGDTQEARDLGGDVTQMQHMIDEYLDFARGDSGEETTRVSLGAALSGIVENYKRMGQIIACDAPENLSIELRPNAFARMMHNLIDNALRYGKTCTLSARVFGTMLEIWVDDEGPGIPESQHDEAFRPFRRLDESRNLNSGGVGLGLTIARDIARGHGGNIALAASPAGGLRVIIRLPL